MELLAVHLPEARVIGSAAGLFLSLALPESVDEARLLAESRCRGVMLDGSNEHAVLPQPPGLAFGFSGGPRAEMRAAFRLFAEAIAAAN